MDLLVPAEYASSISVSVNRLFSPGSLFQRSRALGSTFDPLRTLRLGDYLSTMRTKIAVEPVSGEVPYAHLQPIVEALIEAGNEPSPAVGGRVPNRIGFYQDKDGWRCDLLHPIDFELLDRKFELPSSLSLNFGADSISDGLTWIEISGNRR
jgi:hypothetical protein